MKESGVDEFDLIVWQGVMGPAGMAADVVERLNQAFVAAVEAPNVRQTLNNLALVVGTSKPDEFGAFIRKDLDFWQPVIERADLKAN